MKSRPVTRRSFDVFDWILLAATVPAILAFIAAYWVPLSSGLQTVINYYYWLLFGLFVLEFAIRLWNSESKLTYLRHNWIEVVVILFPFARMLLVFETPFFIQVDQLQKLVPTRHKSILVFIVLSVIAISIASQVILVAEKPYPQSHIHTYSEALWWATVGISTIGIGDVVPISPIGRIITIGLMLFGVVLFGVITADIAAIFTEADVKRDVKAEQATLEKDLLAAKGGMTRQIDHEMRTEEKETLKELRAIERRLDRLESQKS